MVLTRIILVVGLPPSCSCVRKASFQFSFITVSFLFNVVVMFTISLLCCWEYHLPLNPSEVSMFSKVIHDSSNLSLLFLSVSLSTIVTELSSIMSL